MDFYDLLHPAAPRHYGLRRGCPAPREIQYHQSRFGLPHPPFHANQQTWDYAQRECGRLWVRWGVLMLLPTAVLMLLLLGKEIPTVGTVGGIVTVLQMLPLFLSIVIVEKKLREKFDENGLPR